MIPVRRVDYVLVLQVGVGALQLCDYVVRIDLPERIFDLETGFASRKRHWLEIFLKGGPFQRRQIEPCHTAKLARFSVSHPAFHRYAAHVVVGALNPEVLAAPTPGDHFKWIPGG